MVDCLKFVALDEASVLMLNDTHDAPSVKSLLVTSLKINASGELNNEQLEVMTDFFFFAFAFCKETGFQPAKTSTFLAIAKKIIDADNASNSPARTMKTSFLEFKELLLSHAVERPPHNASVFSVDDVSSATEYMLNAYFRHYKLYQYIFTSRLQVTLVQTSPHGVEKPSKPTPLSDAMPDLGILDDEL